MCNGGCPPGETCSIYGKEYNYASCGSIPPCTQRTSISSGIFGNVLTIYGQNLYKGEILCQFGWLQSIGVFVDFNNISCIVPYLNATNSITLNVSLSINQVNILQCDRSNTNEYYEFTLVPSCVSVDGFLSVPVNETSYVYNCNKNEYGNYSRYCNSNTSWSEIKSNCFSCPLNSTSLNGTKTIDDCICQDGFYTNETNHCIRINFIYLFFFFFFFHYLFIEFKNKNQHNNEIEQTCEKRIEEYSNWPTVFSFETVVGKCDLFYQGNPTRICNPASQNSPNGQWGPILNTCHSNFF